MKSRKPGAIRLLRRFCCVLLVLYAVTASAQTDTTLQSPRELQSVDVVAEHKGNAASSTVPTQRFDLESMQQLGIVSIADALKHFAGITVRDYGGAGGMKTVSVRGIGARHTAVAYDGIAISDCQTGEVDLSRFSLPQLSSLSLVVGDGDDIFQPARNYSAAAVLYLEPSGSALQPASSTSAAASLSLGSFGLVSPAFSSHCQLSSRLSLSASGEFFHADNDYPFSLRNVTLTTRERRKNSQMNTIRGELGARWQPDSRNTVSSMLYYYDSHRRLPGIVHLYSNENHERLAEKTAFWQARWRSDLTPRLSLLLSGKYNWAQSDYENRTAGSGLGDASYWQREAYAAATMLYKPTRHCSVAYAVDAQSNSLNSTSSTFYTHPHRTSLLQALSAKATLRRLTLVGRLLYATFRTADSPSPASHASRLTPSLSLSCSLTASLRLRLMAKSVFRMPTFNELYFYHIGSRSLLPERATQLNAGLTWQHGQPARTGTLSHSITADVYINKVSDKIVAVPFNMFVWRVSNLDRATIKGLDITAATSCRISADHHLSLAANYSLQQAMNTTSAASSSYRLQLPYTPLHTFAATLTWENPWANAALTLSGQSARWATVEHAPETRIAGFAEVGLSLWRRLGKATVSASMQNLFDRQYALVARYPMPGRSWQLSLSVPL